MLKDKDNAMKATLEPKDIDWLNSIAHCKESFRLMAQEQVNNKTLMESLAKRQCELTKSNAKILDWPMKIVYGKKKVPLPQIRISNCIPYIIVPQDVTHPPIPFSNPNLGDKIPFEPCKAPSQNETYGTIKNKELTLIEEVDEYLKM